MGKIGCKILLLDDEDMVIKVALKMIHHMGYEAVCAKNGEQAIELYNQAKAEGKPFDLAILDLTIPGGMGGIEVLRMIKNQDSNFKAIVSSGYSNDPIMSDYIHHGFNEVAVKPYKIEELSEAIQKVLEGK